MDDKYGYDLTEPTRIFKTWSFSIPHILPKTNKKPRIWTVPYGMIPGSYDWWPEPLPGKEVWTIHLSLKPKPPKATSKGKATEFSLHHQDLLLTQHLFGAGWLAGTQTLLSKANCNNWRFFFSSQGSSTPAVIFSPKQKILPLCLIQGDFCLVNNTVPKVQGGYCAK